MSIEEARALLSAANIFFGGEFPQEINLNDAFFWACSDGEPVSDEELPELAELFYRYGIAGIDYWVVTKRGKTEPGWLKPNPVEFLDVNRRIEFVRHEEKLRKEIPSSSKRAYTKLKYTLGA